jgi:hypothetical protein
VTATGVLCDDKHFAVDGRRYLRGEAVMACPPTTSYRLRSLISRHKWPVLAASLTFLTLVSGVAVGTWQWFKRE